MSGIVIATYNVLEDAYVRPEYYPRVDPADFRPENRHPRLTAYVAALGADVALLQEVSYASFERIDARLRKDGYVGRWAHKGLGKPDGCATFVRAPFRIATSMIVDLDDGGAKPAGHVALAVVIPVAGAVLTVVNTHIKWVKPGAPGAERADLAQAEHLLSVLAGQPHAIVGGDFNAEPGSDVLHAFRRRGFADPHPASQATFVGEGRPRKIDYLLHTRDLEARPHPTTHVAAETVLPSPSEPSDHAPVIATFAAIA